MGVREWQYIPFESNRMISVYDSGFVFFLFFFSFHLRYMTFLSSFFKIMIGTQVRDQHKNKGKNKHSDFLF